MLISLLECDIGTGLTPGVFIQTRNINDNVTDETHTKPLCKSRYSLPIPKEPVPLNPLYWRNQMIQRVLLVCLFLALVLPVKSALAEALEIPAFKDVSVHDPSIIKAEDGYFYIYGSHMAAAKSRDLIVWEQFSFDAKERNTLVENAQEEMEEALSWARTDTFWAPDVQQLNDGRYYYYYCACVGNAPLSALGVAVSERPEGPYRDLGVFLKSGAPGYQAHLLPNVIDPHTFFDHEGKLWMVYGSYSGGIFILEMNPDTGFPLEDQGYGKKLLGKNHSRIEGPYILYHPDTEYYYLFLSFGGLGAKDGYNIRVARSRQPDGPYLDALGQDMIHCGGRAGSFFRDEDIVDYGAKLMGGWQFDPLPGEARRFSLGFRSPGHNSAYFDEETGRSFIIFHTRFSGQGENHAVRVHQMYFNEEGWPVVSPHRYAGESQKAASIPEQAGDYKIILHLRDINRDPHTSKAITLHEDGSITGEMTGSFTCTDGIHLRIDLDGISYSGVFAQALDSTQFAWTLCFTATSEDGAALWGSRTTAPSGGQR